jgi:hypothetical protein
MKAATVVLLVFTWLSSAYGGPMAGITIKDYQKFKEDKNFQLYLNGIKNGIVFTNVYLEFANKPRLYCPPPKLKLELQNAMTIIDKEIEALRKSDKLREEGWVEPLLLKGLIETFPCKK